MAGHHGSIIDLKAELSRKEEIARQNSQNGQTETRGKKTLDKLSAITGKKRPFSKPSQSNKPAAKEETDGDDLEKQLQRSKEQLQAKCRIYERLHDGSLEDDEDDDGETRYLVDFNKKAIADEALLEASGADEWVEFTDSFGRQRKCQRRDLSKFRDMDPDLVVIKDRVNPGSVLADVEASHLKALHRQWDKEEESMKSDPAGAVHYENVKFDEVRQLGVGYYQFSKNEESRQEQMQLLNDLRKDTLDQRTKQERMKNRKKELMDARLAKIKQKRALKQGGKAPEITTASPRPLSDVDGDTGEARGPSAVELPQDDCINPPSGIDYIQANDHAETVKLAVRQHEEPSSEFAPPHTYAYSTKNDGHSQPATDNVADDVDNFLSQFRS